MDDALQAAVHAAEAGRFEESARRCADLIEAQPDHAGAWSILQQLAEHGLDGAACFEVARALEARGAGDDAIGWWQRGTAGAPRAALGWRRLGLALLRSDRHREAARAFRKAAALSPDEPELFLLLGVSLEAVGRYPAARSAYQQADYLDPLNLDVALRMAGVSVRLHRYRDALAALLHAQALLPDSAALRARVEGFSQRHPQVVSSATALYARIDADPDRWSNAALRAEARGDRRAAVGALERALAGDPAHPTARHLHAAYTGATVSAPPPGYVAQLFDQYARHFDSHLVEELGYTLPQTLVAHAVEAGVSLGRVLDLGCGTGLLSAHVPPASRLVGVDLSSQMLALARSKGRYDVLYHADACAFLEATSESFDLIVAAEVFIYVGALDVLLPAAAVRLAPGGSILVSLELATGDGFRLGSNGRFAHSIDYLGAQAKAAGLTVVHQEQVLLRQSGDGWEAGVLVRLQG